MRPSADETRTAALARTSPLLNTNLRRAFATLVDAQGMHRADLARRLGVTRTTASNIVNALLEAGLVEGEFATSPPPPGENRLKEKLFVAPQAGLLVAITTLTRSTVVAIGTLDGRLLAVRQQPEPIRRPGEERLRQAADVVRELQDAEESLRGLPLRAALVAVNVQTDRETGQALTHAAASVWLDTNPAEVVQECLGIAPIVENAARLAGYAAWVEETHREAHNLIYAHLSHGTGLSHVVSGTLVTGSRGGSGEIGHISVDENGTPCWCGKNGCLTWYVALERLAEQDGVQVEDLVAASPGDEPAARLRDETVADAGRLTGRVLADVCNLLGPDVLVVGGELARYGDTLIEPLAAEARERSLPLVSRHLQVIQSTHFDDPDALSRAALELITHHSLDQLVAEALGDL